MPTSAREMGSFSTETSLYSSYFMPTTSLVPIIEPDISREGDHSLERNMQVTEQVLAAVYKALADHQVYLEGTVLKPSMVTSGTKCSGQASPQEVAHLTLLGTFHSALVLLRSAHSQSVSSLLSHKFCQ